MTFTVWIDFGRGKVPKAPVSRLLLVPAGNEPDACTTSSTPDPNSGGSFFSHGELGDFHMLIDSSLPRSLFTEGAFEALKYRN